MRIMDGLIFNLPIRTLNRPMCFQIEPERKGMEVGVTVLIEVESIIMVSVDSSLNVSVFDSVLLSVGDSVIFSVGNSVIVSVVGAVMGCVTKSDSSLVDGKVVVVVSDMPIDPGGQCAELRKQTVPLK